MIGRRSIYSILNTKETLYTKGGEYSLNGKNYIGEYHEQDGKVFTGQAESDQVSLELTPFYNNSNNYDYDKVNKFTKIEKTLQQPVATIITPNSSDYAIGYYNRQFIQSITDSTKIPIEVSSQAVQTFGKPKGLDNRVNDLIIIKWTLTGMAKDIIEKNFKEIASASIKYPNMVYAVRNYTEFARPNII